MTERPFFLAILITLLIYNCSSNKWNPDKLDEDIYYWTSNEAKCVRLSTRNNRTGCGTYNDGMTAQLRYCNNKTDIINLINENPTNDKIAVVMSLHLLTINIENVDVLNYIASNLTNINGIIFLMDNNNDEILKPPYVSNGYSDDINSPLYYLAPKNHNISYIWNTYGTGNNLKEFKFAIITIASSQSSHIKHLAQSNENNIRNNNFGANYVEFTYPMYSRNNSIKCLEEDNCLPVGGYSVWSTFQDYNITENDTITSTSSNKLIIATASIDTTCLFHQNICRGGNANIAGLIGWLTGIEALSHIKHHINDNFNNNNGIIDKQIIFTGFQGESYDLVGSRKFVYDILPNHFNCSKAMNVHNTGNGCWEPYTSSLDFLKLNYSNIKYIIELSQIGMASLSNDNSKIERILYAHSEQINNIDNEMIINNAINISSQISIEQSMGFKILNAHDQNATDSNIPGTPPSSYWSFLNGNSNRFIPGIVFTDHLNEYSNKWYHSVYDSYYNNLNIEQICMSATLYARLLYKLSLKNPNDYNETFISLNVNADCLLVEQLLECFLLDMSCDLIKNFASKSRDSTPSHYTSVYRIIEDQDIHGTSKFLFRYIANLTRKSDKTFGSCSKNLNCASKGYVCGGTNSGKYCMDSYTYFHAAVEPTMKFNYDTSRWNVPSNSNSSLLIWTESMWNPNIGTRFYTKESDETQIFMLLSGIAMIIINFSVTWRFSVYCRRKFPYLARG